MYVKECVDKECVTKCVLTKSVSKCMLTKCMWTKSVVTKSVWTKSVCVKVYVDKVCVDKKKSERGREAEEAEHGIQNQKQEPHTKLWGKNPQHNPWKHPLVSLTRATEHLVWSVDDEYNPAAWSPARPGRPGRAVAVDPISEPTGNWL